MVSSTIELRIVEVALSSSTIEFKVVELALAVPQSRTRWWSWPWPAPHSKLDCGAGHGQLHGRVVDCWPGYFQLQNPKENRGADRGMPKVV